MKKIFFWAIETIALMVTPSKGVASADGNPFLGAYYVQAGFHGDDIKGLDDEKGAGIRLGMETPGHFFAYEASYFETKHETSALNEESLNGLTFNMKLSFPFGEVIAPYGFVGLGRYALHRSDAVVYRGDDKINGYQVGGGLDIHLSNHISLNLGYTKRRMQFNSGPTTGKIELHTEAITYDAGVTVHIK
jgi:opacity protein-like surface antigen